MGAYFNLDKTSSVYSNSKTSVLSSLSTLLIALIFLIPGIFFKQGVNFSFTATTTSPCTLSRELQNEKHQGCRRVWMDTVSWE